MKYLILALLLVTPGFAVTTAKEARDNADKFNEKITVSQLPSLLNKIDKAIQEQSKLGNYSVSVDVTGYDSFTINKAMNILSGEGYYFGPLSGFTNNQILEVQW